MGKRGKTALVVGATGVVGRALVRQLCESPDHDQVIAWVRRPLPEPLHPKLVLRQVDFDQIAQLPTEAVDEIYCALGTTIQQAGSRERFLMVDVDYPSAVGAWGKRAGAERFLLVSAPNANLASRVFYLQAKGRAEQALRACDYPALDIFHPPIIVGDRPDQRRGEAWAIRVYKWLPRSVLPSYRPMTGDAIAAAMIAVARQGGLGTQVHRLRVG